MSSQANKKKKEKLSGEDPKITRRLRDSLFFVLIWNNFYIFIHICMWLGARGHWYDNINFHMDLLM